MLYLFYIFLYLKENATTIHKKKELYNELLVISVELINFIRVKLLLSTRKYQKKGVISTVYFFFDNV